MVAVRALMATGFLPKTESTRPVSMRIRLSVPPDSANSSVVFSRTRKASSLITTTAMLPGPVDPCRGRRPAFPRRPPARSPWRCPFSWFTPGIAGRSPLASARLMKPESPPAPSAPGGRQAGHEAATLVGARVVGVGAHRRSSCVGVALPEDHVPRAVAEAAPALLELGLRPGRRGARRSRRGGSRGIPRRTGWPGCGRRTPASRWPRGGSPPARAGWPGARRTRGWMRRRLWCRFLGQGSGKNTWMPARDPGGSIVRTTSTASCWMIRMFVSACSSIRLSSAPTPGE